MGAVAYTVQPMKDTLSTGSRSAKYPSASINRGFLPFGVTLTFAKPIQLSSVELSGPIHQLDGHGSGSGPRLRKVDVLVEVSEDNKSWEKAGELKGISAEAGFLPVALPNTPIKGLRLIGNAKPYRLGYLKDSKYGLLSSHVSFLLPMFSWRLYARK